MPPFIKNTSDILDDVPDLEPITELDSKLRPEEKQEPYVRKIVWRNVFLMAALHLSGLYGLYLCFVSAKWQTSVAGMHSTIFGVSKLTIFLLLAFIFYQFSGLGITAGCHRLWSHRAYKARLPLRVFLAFLQTMAFQVNNLFVSQLLLNIRSVLI